MNHRRCNFAFVLALTAYNLVCFSTVTAATVATDVASNAAYSSEVGGAWKGANPSADENPPGADNGGFGFHPWDFSGGFHYPSQSPYGRLNHFIDGVDFAASTFNDLGAPAFALTNANATFGGATSSARRPFQSPLAVGDTLSLRFDNPLLTPLHQQAPSGLIIRVNSGTGAQSVERFALFASSDFNGGAWAASDSVGTTNLGVSTSATSQGAEFRFTLTAAQSYLFELLPLSGGNPIASRSGSLALSTAGAIQSVDIVMYTNGSGNGQTGSAAQPTGAREFFFYNLLITSPGVAGDYDADGDVDGCDFLVWQWTLGSTTNLAADGNKNGVVDGADLTVWRGRFPFAAGQAAAVPEPSAVLLVTLACCGARFRRMQ